VGIGNEINGLSHFLAERLYKQSRLPEGCSAEKTKKKRDPWRIIRDLGVLTRPGKLWKKRERRDEMTNGRCNAYK